MIRIVFVFVVGWALSARGQSFAVGKALFEEQKYAAAKKQLAAIAAGEKDFAAARYYLGRMAFREKLYEEAADYLEEATDADERVAAYFEWYGNALANVAMEANRVRQGLLAPKMKSAWERAAKLDPKSVGPRNSLVEFYLQAPGFMGGSKEKAIAMAREIVALNPAEGHRVLGRILARDKKLVEAEKEYLEAVRLNPDYRNELIGFYVGQRLYEKAFVLFDEALKRNPENMQVHYQLGRTSAISGLRLAQGEASLRKYLAHKPAAAEPTLAGANMRLAQVLEHKGNAAAARKHYEEALRLDAKLEEAKAGLDRVSK